MNDYNTISMREITEYNPSSDEPIKYSDVANADQIFNELNTREKVLALEALMRQEKQVELEVRHYFAYGTYVRELHIPKGVMLTGKVHKYSQFNILTKGEMSVLVGHEVKRIKAPFHVVSEAGTKRIAIAHEDCVWLTIHGTHETDLDKIESYFIAQNEVEYLEYCGQLKLK